MQSSEKSPQIHSSNATVGRTLLEPMFKFVGNMHGDETLGRQLNVWMAEYLLKNYNKNQRVRNLVDSTEIYLMPTMNPDGFSRADNEGCGGGGFFSALLKFGASGRQNANRVDLNRDLCNHSFSRSCRDRSWNWSAVEGRQVGSAGVLNGGWLNGN